MRAIVWPGALWCLTWLASVVAAQDSAAPAPELAAAREVAAIQADARAFVQRLRAASSFEDRSAKMLDLAWLHSEVVAHPQFARSTLLQSVRRELSARLREGISDARRELTRWARQYAARRASGSNGTADSRQGSSNDPAVQPPRKMTQADLDDWTTYYGYRFEAWQGGGTQYLGYLGGNFAPPGHHADRLIRMIERTISPDSWQRQGGNSAIEYFGPAMVLVIRADQRTHDEVQDLLHTLREIDR